jgi:hypothetical protein
MRYMSLNGSNVTNTWAFVKTHDSASVAQLEVERMSVLNPNSCPKHPSVRISHAIVRRRRILATLLIRLYARRVVKRACYRDLYITLPLQSRILAFNTLDASLSERRFKRTFRISRATFQKLCETASSHREEAGRGWSRFPIETSLNDASLSRRRILR